VRDPRTTGNSFETTQLDLYSYWACIERLIDGDTVDVTVSLGFELYSNIRIRLFGIDTSEIHGVKHSSSEYQRGMVALTRLEELVPEGTWVEIKVYQSSTREKYGRWLAEIFLNGQNINQQLIAEGLATVLTA